MCRALWIWLVRTAFWMLYNPLAWAYDLVSRVVSVGQWQAWQRAALHELRPGRTLELACGTGDMLLDLHTAGLRPVGLDLSPAMLRIARRKLCRALQPGAQRASLAVPLVRGRVQRLPLRSASFDSVLSTFPTEFILQRDTLREIARVLRPGGRAVVVATAELVARTPWQHTLVWLYRLTLQRGPLPDLEPQVGAAGLTYSAAWRAAPHSNVLLVMLDKPAHDIRLARVDC
jgi:ubiquinone/menaquinone biosynthesis C-methylase UbiE